jgi:hypothetical protein
LNILILWVFGFDLKEVKTKEKKSKLKIKI